jgi:hypothetical protein
VSIISSDIVPLVQSETAKIWQKNNPELTAGVPPENFEKNWRKTQDEAIAKLKNEGKLPEDLKFEDIGFMNKNYEKGGIFYKEGSNKYGLGNTEIFVQEENDMYCVYDNVYNDENENYEIKKLADFNTMDEAKEFAIEHSKKEYANGGSLPFMTDPNFGNFQNTGAFEAGGINKFVVHFVPEVAYRSKGQINQDAKDLNQQLEKSGMDFALRFYDSLRSHPSNTSLMYGEIHLTNKADYDKVLKLLTLYYFQPKKSFELGGAFMTTDLAGHSGGGTGG